jgi:hypothetical protein
VGRNDLPHESHPLEKDIGDVEEREEPLELGICLVDRALALAQTGGLCITNIGPIEEGQEIYEDYECSIELLDGG